MLNAGAPVVPALYPVRMIEPPWLISGSGFWTVKIEPFTLVSRISSQCSTVISPSGSWLPAPALAKTMSRVPRRAITAAWSRSRSASSETEPLTARLLGPRSARTRAASSASCRRPKMKTNGAFFDEALCRCMAYAGSAAIIRAVFPFSLLMLYIFCGVVSKLRKVLPADK